MKYLVKCPRHACCNEAGKNRNNRRNMEKTGNKHFPALIWPLFAGLALTVVLSWFAASQYLTALPLAAENLRGLALSLSAAVESSLGRDPSFHILKDMRVPDVAYLEIIDSKGAVRFHSNKALIGTMATDRRYAAVFERGEFSGTRVMLGTGETVYESNSPIHVRGATLDLRLALHTYRADSVIRRAKAGMAVSFSLIAATWIMGILLYRSAGRAETHKRELARREQMARLGEMGAVIAHEIRNPLAGIKGYAQLLQEKLAPDENGRSAELIVAEAVRLEEMVNDLLSYSRSDRTETDPVDINDALAGSLEAIAAEAGATGVEIESSIQNPLIITGNRDRLGQLFLNLFRNALQAMPGGGILRVAAHRAKSGIEILIADTGTGIDEKNLGRIFEPFFTTKARGTGLGLAICRKIVEDYSGSITVESRSGEGTTFRITFPVHGG